MLTRRHRSEPTLVRLPPVYQAALDHLSLRTRVRKSEYIREALADLLAQYEDLLVGDATESIDSP